MFRRSLFAACLALACSPGSFAAEAVKLVVPYPPGAALDATARLIANHFKDAMDGSVVVENRAGANGNIGSMVVSRASPDGKTLLMTSDAVVTTNPALYRKTGTSIAAALEPVGMVSYLSSVLVVPAGSKIRTVAEFVEAAKAREMTYASGGSGSAGHLTMAYFSGVVGTRLMHIPYSGGAPAILALVSGEVDSAFLALPNALPQVKAGKLRAIAVSSLQRFPQLPEVPTIAESGFKDFEVRTAYMLMAPARMPADAARKLESQLAAVASSKEFQAQIVQLGMEPTWLGARDTRTWLTRETRRWTGVIEKHGISVDN